MTPDQRGLTLRSNPENFQAGGAVTFKMDFLAQARKMTAPEVWEIDVVFTGTVGGVTGGALGRDAAKIIDNVRFKDSDDVWNTSGAGARIMEQLERGEKQIDPATVSSGATNSSYLYRMRLDFAPYYRALRPRDTAIALANFLDGGEFTLNFAASVPTGWAAVQNDWKVRLYAYVQDGRVKEMKSRRRVKEEAVTQQEFDYQVNGYLRNAILTSKLTTTGYTDLSSLTNFNSRTLNWPAAYATYDLVDDYRSNSQALGTNDEFIAAAPGAYAINCAENDQKIGQMINTKSLHLDLLAAAPTGGRLITDTIVQRNSAMEALSQGYASPEDLSRAVQAMGRVVGEKDSYPLKGFDPDLATRLPIRIGS